MKQVKKRFVKISPESFFAMVDATIGAARIIIDDVKLFTFELKLELAIDKWQKNGDVSALLGLWSEEQFTPQLIGLN